ncbi:MAG: mucin-2 protein [Nocardioidaceae bacterium]|nr:mucin-2 protein [Nocardioidaceae bacterium]
MTRGRHSLAPRASKPRRFALLAAPLLTCGLVGAGVALTEGTTDLGSLATASIGGQGAQATARARAAADLEARETALSRSADRTASTVVAAKVPPVVRRMWTTAALDLRLTPAENAAVAGEIKAVTRIGVTGVRRGDYAQVVVNGLPRWVTASYLVPRKPTDPTTLPLSGAPCPDGSVENGLTADAVRVYRAVCHAFPQVRSYGGWDNHGEHSSGKAIDIMTSDVALGTAIAEFLRAHAAELNLYDVIWRQHIFTQERAGEGWRSMPSRGSATANHFDHVHVSVN